MKKVKVTVARGEKPELRTTTCEMPGGSTVSRLDPDDLPGGGLPDESIIDLVYYHHLGIWTEDITLVVEATGIRDYEVTLDLPVA